MIDEVLVGVVSRSAAISMIDHALPFESMLMAMALKQQKEINKLRVMIEELKQKQ